MKALLYLLAFAALLVVFALAWPVSAIFLAVFLVYAFTNKREHVLAKAVAQVSEPVLLGLLLLGVFQIALNLLRPSAQTEAVHWSERAVLSAQAVLKYTKPPFPIFALVLAVLIAVTAYGPTWKYVTRVLWAKKHLGRVSAVLAVVASFSFCAQAGVLEPQRRTVVSHVQASYLRAKAQKLAALRRYLRAQVVESALRRLSPQTLSETRELLAGVNAVQGVSRAGKLEVVESVARDQLTGLSPLVQTPARTLPELGADPLRALARERAEAARAAHVAEEAEKAAKTLLQDRLDRAPSALVDLAWSYFEALGAPAEGLIASSAKKIGEKVLSGVLEPWTDPVKDELAQRLAQLVTKAVEVPHEPAAWTLFADLRVQRLLQMHMADAVASATRAKTAASQAKVAYDAEHEAQGDVQLALARREADFAKQAATSAADLGAGEKGLVAASALIAPTEAARLAVSAAEAATAAREAAAAVETLRAARALEEVAPVLKAAVHLVP